jgi:hypothetical protein
LHKTGLLLLLLLSAAFTLPVFSCSLYKITAGGKTILGNNEDSWGRDAIIWFEQGTREKYGMACFGYEQKKPNPDGAINEHGLAFDAFTMPHRPGIPERNPRKQNFSYAQLRTIMQRCKTVEEVYAFLYKENLQSLNGSILFSGGMLLFADRSGKYLVVEAGKMTFGNQNTFVLANFNVAETKDLKSVKMERFQKGLSFLRNKTTETTLEFCTALSDTMSVSRARIGDGTLYTNILDLETGLIHLYFFHDYRNRKTFDLRKELSKGDHSYRLCDLFPGNKGYEKFLNHQTPHNNRLLFGFLVFSAAVFLFSSLFFLLDFFRKLRSGPPKLSLFPGLLSGSFSLFCLLLLWNESIFYFPSPYQDPHSMLITASSRIPLLLLLSFLPISALVLREFRRKAWRPMARNLLGLHQFCCLVLLGLFFYWGLFDFLLK